MMTCGRARRLLWPDGGPRSATAEIVAAREHASRCTLCQQFLGEMRRLSDRIREAVPRPEAPVDVRDRLFKAIARARIDGLTGAASRRPPKALQPRPSRAGDYDVKTTFSAPLLSCFFTRIVRAPSLILRRL